MLVVFLAPYAVGIALFFVTARYRAPLLPVLSVLGVSLSRLFGGAVVTETVFALPGIGILLVDSILSRDFPVVQGVIVVVTVGVFLTNLLVELGYGLVDPRVQRE